MARSIQVARPLIQSEGKKHLPFLHSEKGHEGRYMPCYRPLQNKLRLAPSSPLQALRLVVGALGLHRPPCC